MTISDAGNMQEMRVWVMKPQVMPEDTPPRGYPSYSFKWSWGDMVEHKRLIVTRHASLPGAMGSADFKLLRNTIDDNSPLSKHPYTWNETANPLVPGMYVFVTAGGLGVVSPGGKLDYSRVIWFGFIDQIDGDQLAGSTELIGTVSALEVGNILDRMQVRGWAKAGANGSGSSNAITISAPDSANIGGKVDGQIIGNAVLSTDNSGSPSYLFQGDPSLCSGAVGSLFTRWRLFKHIVQNCLTGFNSIGGVTWVSKCLDGSEADNPSGATIAGYLNSTSIPEVFKLRNQTYKGMFDILIPRPFGFGWTIALTAGAATGSVSWKIVLYTFSETASYGLPTFTSYALPIDLGNLPVVNWRRHTSSVDAPDEVVVEGNQIIFGVTGGSADNNMGIGWTPAQETAYRAGASAATGYSSLTASEQLDRNRSIRNSPALSDVYTRYVLTSSTPGPGSPSDLRRKSTEPGIGKGADKAMCPLVIWDPVAGNLSFDPKVSRAPYLPTATLARTLPWIDGFLSSGTDNRPTFLAPWPSFAKPKLFYYDATQVVGKQWIDLLARGGKRSCPGVDIDDRGAAIKVVFDAPERMGYNFIQQGVDAIYDTGTAVSSLPWVEGVDGFDYRKVIFTFGIPSDQRISYRILRPGIVQDSDIRNSLKITDEKYNLWIMHGGSVLSVLADGTPDRVNGFGPDYSVIVRNDFPALVAHANRVAAFAFRRRSGFVYTGMRPDQPWASVGSAVSTVIDGATVVTAADGSRSNSPITTTYNTVVERVECIYGEHPRLIIEADLPSAPNMSGHGSPSTGGPVAVTLNGTVGQAVQQVSQDVKKLQADGQRTPLVAAYNPGGTPNVPSYLWQVVGGSTIPILGTIGVPRTSSAIVPSTLPDGPAGTGIVAVPAWPVPIGLPAGIGVVQRVDLGASSPTYSFVRVDGSYAGAYGSEDLIVGEACFLSTLSYLDKVVGGTTWRYTCLSGVIGYA